MSLLTRQLFVYKQQYQSAPPMVMAPPTSSVEKRGSSNAEYLSVTPRILTKDRRASAVLGPRPQNDITGNAVIGDTPKELKKMR